ncbi:hypothetical protein NLG97_g3661 [Lecanicillium saksenae]|uniref:Uncharacterized protein n=1 Tax=Lecanicillium saksenae TaxID=468837 RepID=A0ACC1R049_9HYPO|nr:hypothetical protein NLG97_g3661 [Lecanicillium saksenae]
MEADIAPLEIGQESAVGTPSFGPVHIIESSSNHTHTAILLHGRGSDGEDFAEELAATTTSDGKSVFEKLPNWRWVFPTSPEIWNATFEEMLRSWFDAYSLTDVTARQDLQMKGLLQSVEYIDQHIVDEIRILSGNSGNILLGGISQGGAVALCTLLRGNPAAHIGGFLAASTWLPFEKNIRHFIRTSRIEDDQNVPTDKFDEYDEFIKVLMGKMGPDCLTAGGPDSLKAQGQRPSVFLSHGSDDAYVDVTLGRQARDVLMSAGLEVAWREYEGAEQEGHWLQSPNQMDDICSYMANLESGIEENIT